MFSGITMPASFTSVRLLSTLFLIWLLPNIIPAQEATPPTYQVVLPTDAPPAANPAEGIALIEPPVASPLGGANLSYPIKLPPARKEHVPMVDLSYSSDHLHGWLGRGWDLGMPTIEVETRWGVPRFNAENESETYLLEGAMLAPVAHRGETRPRTADLSFAARVEREFQRITRHGNGPKNYWWEVRYPDGLIEFYGGGPTGLTATATLSDEAGNISSWALVRAIDVHGNRIDYHYATQADNGHTNSEEPGQNRYPDRISYNGFRETEGANTITFVRDRQLDEDRRPDVRIDFTGGYKHVTADLLRRIEVRYRGELLRHYELTYRTGAFDQTLLTGITEFGGLGTELARHGFDYHELPDGDFSAFGPTETWATGTDEVRGNILNPIPGFTGEISGLGGSASTSFQVGSAVTVGPLGSPASKDFTVGGTFGGGQSQADGLLALVDINGDLLPDKVFRGGDDLMWRKNRFAEGLFEFGPVRPINGIRDFSVVSTSEVNLGFEANVTPFFAGYENTTARTKTTTYFSDFNGDDLVDILHKGKIYFNHLNAEGNPTFTLNSGDTPSPIIAGANPDGDLVTVNQLEQQELIDMTPKHDVVRSWEAPFDGTVRISGDISLAPQPGIDEYLKEDGVTVSIETGGNLLLPNTINYSATIPANDYAARTPTGVANIRVTAGQRIYFRVRSIFDGAFDRVNWDPEIAYLGEDLGAKDINGLPIYRFQASEDFLLASCQTVAMPLAGRVDLLGTFSKPELTDTLHLELLSGTTLLFSRKFAPDEVVEAMAIEYRDFAVAQDQQLQLRLRADCSIDWTAPTWSPRLVYTSADDGTQVISSEGDQLYTYCPAIDYTMRTKLMQQAEVWRPRSESYTYGFGLNYLNPLLNFRLEEVSLCVRGRDTTYLTRDTLLPIVGTTGAMGWGGDISVVPGDSIWIEVYTSSGLDQELRNSRFSLSRNGTSVPVTVGKHRKRTSDEMIFGPQFRGWGQFVYRGEDGGRGIVESLLRLQENDVDIDEEDIEEIEINPDNPDFGEFEDLADDPTKEQFIVMVADPKAGNWRGYDNLTLLGPDYQSSSRLGEDDVLLSPELGTGGGAPPLTSIAKIEAVSVGAGYGPASLAGSVADNTTTNLMEVMDLNGDQYPDLVTPTRAQYTTVYGGLSERSIVHGFGNHVAKSRAIGGTAGGKFVDSSPTNSGDGSGKGSRKRFRKAKAISKNQGAKAQSANESAEAGGSISVSFSVDNDYTVHSWLDVNGDGLTDKVWDNGEVAFNYGYRFGAKENWGFADIRRGRSTDYGGGAGVNISNNSFAAGFAITRTDNYSSAALQDMNGDGLADALSYNSDTRILRVALNTGTGFSSYTDWATLAEPFDKGDATAESLNFAFTVCIPVFFIRICVNPSGSTGRGVSRVLSQFNDIDGDGFLDELVSTIDNELKVRRSTIGKANLLRSITRPLGGSMELDYAAASNDYGLPFPKWLLSETRLNDGVDGDGPVWRTVRMYYESPVHDRHEREFYGFSLTRETYLDTENGDAPYRSSVVEYSNDNFYNKNLPIREYTEDADGKRYRETGYRFELRDPETMAELPPNLVQSDKGRAFPALTSRMDRYYEGADEIQLEKTIAFTYDAHGQVLSKDDFGDGTEVDLLRTEYTYHEPTSELFLANQVKSLKVFGGTELLRHSEMDIDGAGNILQLRKYLDDQTFAAHDFTYDDYGNTLTATKPENLNGERMRYVYKIDSTEYMYALQTEDSHGYVSTAEYDYRFGRLLGETDVNGHRKTYLLDEFGRVTEIKLPKDSTYSFRYSYRPEASPAYAVTRRFNPDTDADVQSTTMIDGLGRVLQQKHESVVNGAERIVASGRVEYDAFDRPVSETYPFVTSASLTSLTPAPATAPASRSTFDVLDRPTSLVMPNNSRSEMQYGMVDGPTGRPLFREALTDALGFRETTLTDDRGRDLVYLREADTTTITTFLKYNNLNELLQVTDNGGYTTSYTYDRLGRKIGETPADGGLTEHRYDLADNLISKLTPNLRETMGEDGGIRYLYDYERLVGIHFPINFQNKVEISYGGPEARFNRVGRIVLRQDASGGEEYFYNEHGQTRKTIRTLLINESTARTFVSEVAYDSWGRELTMGYPDGEVASYTYNSTGKLTGLRGEKDGNEYSYLEDVRYDEFGRITSKTMGNGSEQKMTFDPLTRRPASISVAVGGTQLQNLRLRYDVVGNLESNEQSAAPQEELGGPYRQQYVYDPLHRLTEATGNHELTSGAESYVYLSDHDDLYNQTRRELSRETDGEPDPLNGYNQTMVPSSEFPHRIDRLGGRTHTYDANGNLLSYQGEAGSYRYQQSRWDEENRMMEFSDNGTLSRYTYAADGERAIRSQGAMKGVFSEGALAGFLSHSGDYTAYVSPFFTFTKDGYSKHYFLGDTRILTKQGTGEFNNTYWYAGGLTAGDLNYTARMDALTNTVWNYYAELGLPPGPPTLPGYYGQPGITGAPLPTGGSGDFGSGPGLGNPGPGGPPDAGGPPGSPTWYASPPERDSVGAGFGYEGYGVFPEVIQSYFHGDHLGNVCWVTDMNGQPVAYRAYLPTGELLTEQAAKTPPINYTFNGKEKDAASGLHYFGARYLEAETGRWLSPDPLADEFPGHNPYAFALHNPLRYLDPDGREAFDMFSSPLAAAVDFARIYNERSIFHNYEYGTLIYKQDLNGKSVYFYDQPATDLDDSGVTLPPTIPFGEVVADVHTHSRMEHGADGYLEHSSADLDGNDHDKRPGYVANPKGELRLYRPGKRKIETVATGLPFDQLHYGKDDPNGNDLRKHWARIDYAQVSGQTSTSHTKRQSRRNGVRYSGKPLSGNMAGADTPKRWGWHGALKRKPVRKARVD